MIFNDTEGFMMLVERAHQSFDEQVITERLNAVSDWYYLYHYERMGVFRAVFALQERFAAGHLQLSRSPAALSLQHFDSREVVYYTRHDRRAAYARLFGYGNVPLNPHPNLPFRDLFYRFNQLVFDSQYNNQTCLAAVRQAALDLRNNLYEVSYGQIHVLRLELIELLDVALRICDSPAIQRDLNADTRWAVIEQSVGERQSPYTLPHHQMALAGRVLLRWLARPQALQQTGQVFADEVHLLATHAQAWLSASDAIRGVRRGIHLPQRQLISPDGHRSAR
jgi:hypothetical protein